MKHALGVQKDCVPTLAQKPAFLHVEKSSPFLNTEGAVRKKGPDCSAGSAVIRQGEMISD